MKMYSLKKLELNWKRKKRKKECHYVENFLTAVSPRVSYSNFKPAVPFLGSRSLSRDDRLVNGYRFGSSVLCLLLLKKKLSMKWGKCGNQLKTAFSPHICID